LFSLAGNFPNPFNPGTTIRFSTHGMRPGVATIRIYNILGQLIATMTIVVAESGQFDVYWNGRSDAGRVVPSGVYLYTVELQGELLRGSMILVK
jgi:flagellar hook assembly protein FlgD